ncbi:MAG TPA: beta-ketoacyl synthase N-terminal-like domain-containing protein [Thermoanaerobaculia bacterium]|nr:beta-ketoacyl synthase N-terminal-like domain-containing protein [Thermoanaerobaculia bacterium]
MRRVGIFGWGIVAPRSRNIEAFAANLEAAESWLTPFHGFGPDTFLVGQPEFSFEDYRPWIVERFPPSRFHTLEEKMDLPTLYAIGSFVQALGQNPGLERELSRLGTQTRVYVGTGLGNLQTTANATLALRRAQRRWDRFWAERNPDLASALAGPPEDGPDDPARPPRPDSIPEEDREAREDAEGAWWAYWAGRSEELAAYLAELAAVESLGIHGDVEKGKMSVLKEKQRRQIQLQKDWQTPEPPWRAVSANLLWNIQNTPSSQISILGKIHGLAFAPVAACSTFGVSLRLAIDAIRSGDATAVVVGATDPPPLPITVAAFYAGRVISADAAVSKPLTTLRGTHVAGGAVVWIVADYDHMTARGFKPLGLEPVSVGVSSDADHIITPSTEGPTLAIREAIEQAGIDPAEIGSWDLHATATPGDWKEVETLRSVVPGQVLVTARKGTFGHGMSAGGGWELTAQYLGYERGRLYPTPLAPGELNSEIGQVHPLYVFDAPCAAPPGPAGKLSMGIGGINACVISRPWRPSR